MYTTLLVVQLLACSLENGDDSVTGAEIRSYTVAAGEKADPVYISDALYQVELCYPDGRCVQDSRGVRHLGRLAWPSWDDEAPALEAPPDANLVVRVGG
jgi:hypothetical protein